MGKGKNRSRRNTGVTLFEVMIAIALFAIIIVPVMRSFVGSIRVNQKSRKVMIATDVAETIAESFAGKSYVDVLRGLSTVNAAFDFTKETSKYAFSTINDNYYNQGHAEQVGFPDTVTPDTKYQGYTLDTTVASQPLDKVLAVNAVSRLRDQLDGCALAPTTAGKLLDPYEDAPFSTDEALRYIDATPGGTAKPSIDKVLYWGVSGYDTTKIVTTPYNYNKDDPLPYMAFMVYHRIQKENYFFDAVVTFVPRAQNKGVDEHANTVVDYHFAYEVKVTVYEYDANPTDHEYRTASSEEAALGENRPGTTVIWPSRYLGNYIEGSPIAVMTTGIQSRSYEGTN